MLRHAGGRWAHPCAPQGGDAGRAWGCAGLEEDVGEGARPRREKGETGSGQRESGSR